MRHARFTTMIIASFVALSLVSCTSTATRERTGEYIDDSTIAAKVKSALANDQALRRFNINVESHQNVVQLTGTVDTPQRAEHAQEVAANVGGVRTVHNKLVVK